MTMQKKEIQSLLLPIISNYIPDEVDATNLTLEMDLIKDLQINSAYIIDIVIEIEEIFDISIQDEAVIKINTIQEAIDVIFQETEKKA